MKHVAALLFCLLALGANAQPVYRCGNEYSQTPCPQGRVVEADDSRTAAQLADGQRVAANEQRRVADMQRELFAEQAAQRPAQVTGHHATPAALAKPASSGEPHPSKKRRASEKAVSNGPFIGTAPGSKKLRVAKR